MEQLLMQLTRRAHAEQVVALQTLVNGSQLLAYPLATGLIVGVGFARESAHLVQTEALIRKRSLHLSRFGAWLPALLADGSCYVVRRIEYFNPSSEVPVLTDEELMAAQELLS